VAPIDGVYHGDGSTKYNAVKKFWPGPGAYERIADCSDSAYPAANAKLIAAAPDMADLLLSWSSWYRGGQNPAQLPALGEWMHDVIAKAGLQR